MGRKVKSTTLVENLQNLNKQYTAHFRVLPIGTYDGILGTDWLDKNDAHLQWKTTPLTFVNKLG